MMFLVGLVPYWLGGAIKELLKERKAAKEAEQE